MKNASPLSDRQTVERLLSGDAAFAEVFFKNTCRPLLSGLNRRIFMGKLNTDHMAECLHFYLKQHDWHRLRTFRGETTLYGWLRITARHLFYDNRHEYLSELTKPRRGEPVREVDESEMGQGPIVETTGRTIIRVDIRNALSSLKNDKERYVIQTLILEDKDRKSVAASLGVTPGYLDIIRNRALKKMRTLLTD